MKKKYSEEELIVIEKTQLAEHVPLLAVDYVHSLFRKYPCNFKIVPPRKGKLGDCRYPMYNKEAQITVNGDLSPFQFLITTIHEFAHLKTFLDNGIRVTPHGKEWKTNYIYLFQPVIENNLLEPNELEVLKKHLSSPSATSCNDHHLSEFMHAENRTHEDMFLLKNIEVGARFEFQGRAFFKGNLVQKKYIIYDAHTHRDYRLSGLANIKLLPEELKSHSTTKQFSLFESLFSEKKQLKTLESLSIGDRFKYDHQYYILKEKKRTRFVCQNEKSKQLFSMHKDLSISL